MGQGNTKAIGQAIATFLQGVQYNNAPLYSIAKLGTVTDPTDVAIYGAVTFQQGMTKRYTNVGWKIDDTPGWLIESGIDQTNGDTSVIEEQLMDIRDLLIATFAASVSLNSTGQVYDVTLYDVPDKAAFKVYPNGRIYRVHQLMVKAHQQFNVTLQ